MPPRLARLLAVIIAVALVAGAFVLRGAIAGDDEGGSGGGGGSSAPFRVACDEDLGVGCEALERLEGVGEVTMLDAADALEQMGEGRPPFDAWLTLDPLPEILDVAREQDDSAPVADGDAERVASSALALLAFSDVECPAPVDWSCVTGLARSADVGLPSRTTSVGVLALAAATAGLVGSADFGIDQARAEEVRTPLEGLLDSARPTPTADQVELIITQRGRYSAVVTTTGLADRQADSAQGRSVLDSRSFRPSVAIGVVLASIGTRGPDAVDRLREGVMGDTVQEALADAGWSGPPERSSGLPDPDVIYALRLEFDS